jgi:hypothetical protein
LASGTVRVLVQTGVFQECTTDGIILSPKVISISGATTGFAFSFLVAFKLNFWRPLGEPLLIAQQAGVYFQLWFVLYLFESFAFVN